MNKPELIEKLTALGVVIPEGAKKVELEKLLAEAEATPVEEAEATPAGDTPPDEEKVEGGLEVPETAKIEVVGGSGKVDIYDSRNFSYVRTYSRERHGEKFGELAKEFLAGHLWAVIGKAQDRGAEEK